MRSRALCPQLGNTIFGWDAALGEPGVHAQTLVKVAVHDVAKRFTIRFGHVRPLLIHGVEQSPQIESLDLRAELLVRCERISTVLLPLEMREEAVEDFPVNAPPEQLLTHPCEERSGLVLIHCIGFG
jgi:hypothetical protein